MKSLVFLIALSVIPGAALAQSNAFPVGASVRSVVVADDKLVVDKQTPLADSGLTISPKVETPAETARRDAVDLLNGAVNRGPVVVPIDAQTVVEVKSVVSESKGPNAHACVQVGVIGAQDKCRPQ